MKTFKLFLILILITGLSESIARADFIFSEPTIVPNVNSDASESYPQISRDGLELYFTSNRDGSFENIWISRRLTINDPWSEPVKLDPPVNRGGIVISPSLSADGLELYHDRKDNDLWVSTRVSKDDPWGEPVKLEAPVNTGNRESHPCLSADGLELYFMSDRPGGGNNPSNTDIFVATRPTKDDPWGEPVILSYKVNGDQYESLPFISPDGLLLFFSRGYSKGHVHVCRRPTTTEPWGPAEFFTPINSGRSSDVWGNSPGKSEFNVSFSEGDSTIYFTRGTDVFSNDWNIWQVKVTPVVDFNSDKIVDSLDVSIMIQHWHTFEPLCDIAPLPMGDGFVDIQDLTVLTEHLDWRAVAYWRLDEAGGSIAHDSIHGFEGTCHGEPLWLPDGGIAKGALQFDGTDDYVSTPFVINPADDSLSVLVWIQGGVPGQAIISQANSTFGSNSTWLAIDPSDGQLVTRLMHPPFPPLVSDIIVADGQWHQIGLVYDRNALKRHLYVDGVEVAKDMGPVPPIGSDGGLYIGADENLSESTFFFGLIDDVRIYNQALGAEEITNLNK